MRLAMRVCALLVTATLPAVAAASSVPVRDHVGDAAADVALRMQGKPYRYGGSSPSSGFDCSGLVQFSFREAGAAVPRSADAQRQASIRIRLSELRRGDLVFFDQEGKKNSHLGIYIGNGEFVHAPSSGKRVRRDRLNVSYWRKHISEARRVVIPDVVAMDLR